MWIEGRGQVPGQLIVVSGPSGSGKSTLIRRALGHFDQTKLRLSVSATTRDCRQGEEEGRDYFYLHHEAFRKSIDNGEFLEHAEYDYHLYGTPAKPVYDALAVGESIILEIEVNGAKQVCEKAPSTLFFFIKPPDFRTLETRLKLRGTETDSAILRRLRHARAELREAYWFDVELINDELDDCVTQFVTILRQHGCGG